MSAAKAINSVRQPGASLLVDKGFFRCVCSKGNKTVSDNQVQVYWWTRVPSVVSAAKAINSVRPPGASLLVDKGSSVVSAAKAINSVRPPGASLLVDKGFPVVSAAKAINSVRPPGASLLVVKGSSVVSAAKAITVSDNRCKSTGGQGFFRCVCS